MKTKDLTFTALVISIAGVLNLLSGFIPIFKMPQGGSVVLLSTLLIMLISIKFGVKIGLITGFIYGLLNYLMFPWFVHPIQLILDYFFAFMVFGLGSLFIVGKVSTTKILVSYFICSLLRFICSYTAGVIFYRAFAPIGQSPEIYSFIYNISYILPEYIINVGVFLVPTIKNLFTQYFIIEN